MNLQLFHIAVFLKISFFLVWCRGGDVSIVPRYALHANRLLHIFIISTIIGIDKISAKINFSVRRQGMNPSISIISTNGVIIITY